MLESATPTLNSSWNFTVEFDLKAFALTALLAPLQLRAASRIYDGCPSTAAGEARSVQDICKIPNRVRDICHSVLHENKIFSV